MSTTTAAEELYRRERIASEFERAHVRLVRHLLGAEASDEHEEQAPSWSELLTWASLFVASDNNEHVELGIIAAVSALLTASGDEQAGARASAAAILEEVANLPTVHLAHERGLVSERSEAATVAALLQRHRGRLRSAIYDDPGQRVLPVTPFQLRTWSALHAPGDVAISAPTSAGKSFILLRWLIAEIGRSDQADCFAYLVPSRALIRQVSRKVAELARAARVRPLIATLPTMFSMQRERPTVLVMTQERFERLLALEPTLAPRALVVDEAQKLGAGPRGVILQRVIDESLRRLPTCRVVVAAPHASNVETLLPRSHVALPDAEVPPQVVRDARPTVTQNLIWVEKKPWRSGLWTVHLVHAGEEQTLGDFALTGKLTGKKKRMAAIAVGLGSRVGGNIVFANEPAEAEAIAALIADMLRNREHRPVVSKEVMDLVRLIRTSIHKSYPPVVTLSAGVGIHYGDMPEIARREQERLFDAGMLRFLVCTSTLLEGVNLPCQNLFIWGPKQGRTNPMSLHTFWNLAGRAGRWGREFAGNIFCIQVRDVKDWPDGPPRRRELTRVTNAGTEVLGQVDRFVAFAASTEPEVEVKKHRYHEQVLGELVSAVLSMGSVASVSWLAEADEDVRQPIEEAIGGLLDRVSAPDDIVKRHSGIHPVLISQFLEFLSVQPRSDAAALLPMSPDMNNPVGVLAGNLGLCDQHLGSEFGVSDGQRWLKARVTVDWIWGRPLGRMIDDRIEFLRDRGDTVRVPSEIRKLMKLINENARYLVPKYLACYADCVRWWLASIGEHGMAAEIDDLQDLFEAGVADNTMLALIALGLSRTAAVELARRIPESDLSVGGVVDWLGQRDLMAYDISPVIIREVESALESSDLVFQV